MGTTVIDSPWTDDARAEAEALWELEQMLCPQCGNLREECEDPTRLWYPQRHICYATRERLTADRKYDEKHKDRPYHNGDESRWSDKPLPKMPYHFHEGVRVYVAPVDVKPDDNFL